MVDGGSFPVNRPVKFRTPARARADEVDRMKRRQFFTLLGSVVIGWPIDVVCSETQSGAADRRADGVHGQRCGRAVPR
jgi:hypothetical protein